MLALKKSCENCDQPLPNESNEAMICTYECTFCITCVKDILHNVCPNCGGGFEKRPSRPKKQLDKYPMQEQKVFHPVALEKFQELLDEFKDVDPRKR